MANETSDLPSQTQRRDRRLDISERPEDERKQRLVLTVAGVLILAIAGVLIAGFVIVFVFPTKEDVVRVNDARYSRGDMVKVVRVSQSAADTVGQKFDATKDIFGVLQRMVENEIISQTAPSMGITITEEQVDVDVRSLLEARGTATAGKDAGQVEREFRERYGSYLNLLQMSEEEHRKLVRQRLLRVRFRAFIGDTVPTVAEHVHLYRLTIPRTGEIDIMMTKFEDAVGDNTEPLHLHMAFKEISKEFSQDTGMVLRNGGEIGWIPLNIMPKTEFAFFQLEPGKLSHPVPQIDDPNRIQFFMISERNPAQDVTPAHLESLKSDALQNWLNDEREKHDIFVTFNQEVYFWIIEQLAITSRATPEAQAGGSTGF